MKALTLPTGVFCKCDGGAFEVKRYPFLVVDACPIHGPCETQVRRATMTDDEFWQDVADVLMHGRPLTDEEREGIDSADWDAPPPHEPLDLQTCPECGETGACGYDALGRPLIHPTRAEDD